MKTYPDGNNVMVVISLQFDNPVILHLLKSTYVLQVCLIKFLNFTLVVAFCTFSGSIFQSFIPLTKGVAGCLLHAGTSFALVTPFCTQLANQHTCIQRVGIFADSGTL